MSDSLLQDADDVSALRALQSSLMHLENSPTATVWTVTSAVNRSASTFSLDVGFGDIVQTCVLSQLIRPQPLIVH